jgi:fructan beta-fructosidase
MRNTHICSAVFLLISAMAGTATAADDIIVADFEKDTYEGWTVTGDAFGPGPAKGTLPGQMQVDGYQGEGLVNSFFNGDNSVGSLTSPQFRVERKFISFLIGGDETQISSPWTRGSQRNRAQRHRGWQRGS